MTKYYPEVPLLLLFLVSLLVITFRVNVPGRTYDLLAVKKELRY